MAKYSDEHLTYMAKRVLQAQKGGDERYFVLIMRMCLMTGWPADHVTAEIERLAEG